MYFQLATFNISRTDVEHEHLEHSNLWDLKWNHSLHSRLGSATSRQRSRNLYLWTTDCRAQREERCRVRVRRAPIPHSPRLDRNGPRSDIARSPGKQQTNNWRILFLSNERTLKEHYVSKIGFELPYSSMSSWSLRLLGSLRGSLGTYGLTQKLC